MRSRSRAILGLLPLSAGVLAAFAVLDLLVTATAPRGGPPASLIFTLAASIAQTFLAATYWLALPAAAVDGHGVFSALVRARGLARGARFPLAVLLVMLVLLGWAAALVFGLATRPENEGALAPVAVFFITIKACVLAAAYREACLLEEGPPADEIGAIFS